MKNLDEIIGKNKKAFNNEEPSAGHFDKFQGKLAEFHEERESWFSRHWLALRIAASILVFISIGLAYYSNPLKSFVKNISQQVENSGLPQELQEAMHYYNIITDKRMGQIAQLTSSNDDAGKIREMALKELKTLDENKAELENDLTENPSNERILNALVINRKKQAEILNRIINTLQRTQQ
jgi:hypothetical protein